MPLPQHLTYSVGGTVSIDIDDLPSNARINLLDSDNTELISSRAANISTINTSLSSNANEGDYSVSVSSNTGILNGSKFFIQDDPEEVLVRKVEGTTIYLRRPLIYDHISGAECEGTRIFCQLNSTDSNSLFWDGRVEWNIDGTIQHYTAVECTRYPLDLGTTVTTQDFLDEEPKLYHLMDREEDLERLKEMAVEYVVSRIAVAAQDLRARVYPGSSEFKRAVTLAGMMIFYRRQRGDDAFEMMTRYKEALNEELGMVAQTTPRDADQDEVIEAHERISMRTVSLRRG